jgi:hypothetical protein
MMSRASSPSPSPGPAAVSARRPPGCWRTADLERLAAALPVFQCQGGGHFVTTVSTAGLKIVPNQGVYAATKNAVRTQLEGLR